METNALIVAAIVAVIIGIVRLEAKLDRIVDQLKNANDTLTRLLENAEK